MPWQKSPLYPAAASTCQEYPWALLKCDRQSMKDTDGHIDLLQALCAAVERLGCLRLI